ncbi:helix-turn-helix domain-containing protein [Mucilaginibacter sp. P25]|uniref:Helix-turn-helix n=1 Tax=Mucilaginibacter gossypii TaxID=551996 RepID=A0A1G7WAF4_9SPHI|nr:helix-turn-helix transcriptional regulator [Mucilaginibacter gossypii]SDG68983.1 Helix-turn-helix [Mucilaginibacter gossypii]
MKTYNPGKKIKELRNRKGLSQEELAEQAQLSLRTVQRIENDEQTQGAIHLKDWQPH